MSDEKMEVIETDDGHFAAGDLEFNYEHHAEEYAEDETMRRYLADHSRDYSVSSGSVEDYHDWLQRNGRFLDVAVHGGDPEAVANLADVLRTALFALKGQGSCALALALDELEAIAHEYAAGTGGGSAAVAELDAYTDKLIAEEAATA